MELSSSPMTERQRNYRATYRHRIAGWYNGWLHVFVIYVIGFTALSVYFGNISDLRWWEFGIVPVTFLFANFFEWWIHRYVMHRPSQIKAFRAIYNRHTLMHHQFFTEQEMRFADHHDWRVTFFPPYALVTFTMMSILAGDRPRLADLAQCRLAADLDDDVDVPDLRVHAFLLPCRRQLVRAQRARSSTRIRRHHTAHHNQSIMMERNMNLTFPVMDWLFGTSDLDRGLIGHLLNGYDTRFVKTDMRKTSRTPIAGHGTADPENSPRPRNRRPAARGTTSEQPCRRSNPTGSPCSGLPVSRRSARMGLLIVAGMFPLRTVRRGEIGHSDGARRRQRRPAGGAAGRYGALRLCRTQV